MAKNHSELARIFATQNSATSLPHHAALKFELTSRPLVDYRTLFKVYLHCNFQLSVPAWGPLSSMTAQQHHQRRTLVIVPCGVQKIWDKQPQTGPTAAKHAYVSGVFKLNRQYAERFGDQWVILSAKYGFIDPDFVIPEAYEVTFKRKSTSPITPVELSAQVSRLHLGEFGIVVGLGGKEYRSAIAAAFHDFDVELQFPFEGLTIGKAMRATKLALGRI